MYSSGSTVRPCYLEQDHGLASLKDMEGGHCANSFVSRSMTMGYATSYNRSSFRNLSVSSPRSARFYDARFEDHQPHFLEACFLCKKPLGDNRDIFMYRLDTQNNPFIILYKLQYFVIYFQYIVLIDHKNRCFFYNKKKSLISL